MFKIKRQQAAGANCSAMEQRPFQKRVQLKNQRSRRNFLTFCVIIPIFFSSCVSPLKFYTKPDATSYTMKHKTIAIMPSKVKVLPSKYKKEEDRNELEMSIPLQFQADMTSEWLNFISKGKLYVEVQDANKTNRKLIEIGCPLGNCNMAPEELAKALGVDAILLSDLQVEHYKQIGGGIFMLTAGWSICPANILVAVSCFNLSEKDEMHLILYDANGDLLWRCDGFFVTKFLNDNKIVRIKKAIEKSPYYRK